MGNTIHIGSKKKSDAIRESVIIKKKGIDPKMLVPVEKTPLKNFVALLDHSLLIAIDEGIIVSVKRRYGILPKVNYSKVKIEKYSFAYNLTNLQVLNLPPREEGIEFIVSKVTLRAINKLYPNRDDFWAPGDQFHVKDGKVMCAIGLVHKMEVD